MKRESCQPSGNASKRKYGVHNKINRIYVGRVYVGPRLRGLNTKIYPKNKILIFQNVNCQIW